MNVTSTSLQETVALWNVRRLSLYLIGALITITAITWNAIVVAVYSKSSRLKDSTWKLILNLAIADCLSGFVGLVILTFRATGIVQISWLLCLLPLQSMSYLTQVSGALVFATTLERYIGICQRSHYTKIMTKAKVYILHILSWCLPSPLTLMPFLGFNNWNTTKICQLPGLLPSWIHIVNTTFLFIFIITATVLYTKILLKAREFYNRPRPMYTPCINPQSTQNQERKTSIRNGKIIGFVTLAFIVCCVPHHAYYIINIALGNGEYSPNLSNIFFFLRLSNSCMNPFIYAWQKRNFRSEFRTLFRCRIKAEENRDNRDAVTIDREARPSKERRTETEVHRMFLVEKKSCPEDVHGGTSSNAKTSPGSSGKIFTTTSQMSLDAPCREQSQN